jgi:hypothetical protein
MNEKTSKQSPEFSNTEHRSHNYGVGNADTLGHSLPLLQRGGNGAEPVTEGHADKLNGSWGVLVAISQAAQGAGHVLQRIRDGLGGVFIALGKVIEGRDERIAGGHRVGDVITYRPVGQASSLQARIVRIVGEAAKLSNGAVVSADRIRERGLA